MDRNSRPPGRNRERNINELPAVGPVASAGTLGPPPPHHSSDNVAHLRNLSPSPSRRSPLPATPAAASEAASTEYFPAFPGQGAPSLRSRASVPDSVRPPSSGNASAAAESAAARLPRQPSIRIRRRGSSTGAGRSAFVQALADRANAGTDGGTFAGNDGFSGGRARSLSQPERSYVPREAANIARHSRKAPPTAMPRLTEEGARPTMEDLGLPDDTLSPTRSLPEDAWRSGAREPRPGRMRRMSRLFRPRRQDGAPQPTAEAIAERNATDEYNAALVDYLDTIDPEVQTLSTLTNVQNSLFVPDLGSWLNRRPTYSLSQHDVETQLPRQPPPPAPEPTIPEVGEDREEETTGEAAQPDGLPVPLQRSSTITSRLTDSHYAALPHGASLEGWTADEKWELDDHVRHMLHSRRSKFKRSLKGFGQYVRRPLGFLVTLYATLITLFGLAWVLFLIGWIYVGERQVYVIHIIDSVLVALFAVMGDGLAPFRAIDTYHMIFVIRYARLVRNADKPPRNKLKKRNVPRAVQRSMDIAAASQAQTEALNLQQRANNEEDDRASQDGEEQGVDPHTMRNNIVVDVEDAKSGISAYDDTPLSFAQQKKLHHHQTKLAKSHSFYKPNETDTHYAFPLGSLIAIVILLDCHSCLQISLGATTWGIDYHTRPFAITTVILCVSIACNITAGIVITVGDRKTRKKDVWNLMTRQELTSDAIKLVERKRTKDSNEKSGSSDSDKDARALEQEAQEKEAREQNKLVRSPT